jgi:hypothetical protein
MNIRHLLPSSSCRKTIAGDRAVLLRNQIGSTFTEYTTRQTRYEGWYLQESDLFYKILERIEVVDENNTTSPVTDLTTTGDSFFWQDDSGKSVGFMLAPQHNGLIITSSQPATLRLIFDTRSIYSEPTFGRDYTFLPDDHGYLLRYFDPILITPLFIHIRTSGNIIQDLTWNECIYPRDNQRNSPPSHLYLYTLGTITTRRLALGAGWSEDSAREASFAANHLSPAIYNMGNNPHHDTLFSQTNTAKSTVKRGLRMLQTQHGLYAGLPWFHQVWSRDELITALGLSREEQHEIIERYIGLQLENGELPTYQGSHTTCADGVGWLCLLVREYGEHLLPDSTKIRLLHFLTTAREQLQTHRKASHGLFFSGHNGTWMDTIGRSGFRIEIQCMFALVLDLLHSLTEDSTYEQERLLLLGKIRQHYWKGTYLADGLGDPTIRPNVFLAYLLQPDLLQQNQWGLCFDTAIASLTCTWGGIASLDPTHADFKGITTGENNLSYHNGDSWFFINNLAGIAMHRLDDNRFGKQVVGILQSSTDEILWHNMLGLPGEISSAFELDSFGCGLQGFSGGTYLALLNELETHAGQGLDSTAFFWGASTASN